jgi:hypothetical protein
VAGAHARIAPSALAIIVECAAHVQMAEPYRDAPPTPESLEGDAGHHVAASYANGSELASGASTPQGVPVDEDMIAGARLWRDTVGLYGMTELPVVIERIHLTECAGTPDWWRWDPIEGVLRVWDYKYGHLFVEVFENWQLIAYAVGLLDTLKLDDQITRVEMGIVQPRSYHKDGPVRRWSVMGHELRALVNRAHRAAEEALGENPTAKTGSHCEFCPGRHDCRTLQNAAMSVVDFSGTMDRVNLPAPAVAAELTILDAAAALLEARRTGLQQQAMAMIRRGERVPGFALEAPAGRLKWTATPDEVAQLGDVLGIQLRKPLDVLTPTQAIAAGLDAAVINGQYADRPKGALKLVTDTTTQARKVFGANTV